MQLLKERNYLFTRRKFALRVLFVSLLITACNDDDPEIIPTSLQVVVKEGSTPVNATNVTLYTSQQDWMDGVNPVASGLTDSEGKITFMKELSPVVYYIDVFKDNTTNWHDEVALPVLTENQLNKAEVSVISSIGNYITGKTEKSWVLTDALVEGVSIFTAVDDCEKDDVLFFQREEQLGLEDVGDLLCEGEISGQFAFQWALENAETALTLVSEDGSGQRFELESVSPDRLIFILELDIEGVISEVFFIMEPLD